MRGSVDVYVWTDFGGVLTPPVEDSVRNFCAAQDISPAELRMAMQAVAHEHGVTDFLEPLDRPLVDEETWLREVNEVLLGRLNVTTLAEVWFDDRPTNTDWLSILTDLKKEGTRIGLISNMVPTWDTHWRRMVDPDVFDDIVLSYQVGHRKPEAPIFELAARQAGVLPDHCVLVDDLLKNCQGAEDAGWKSVHFTDAGTAARSLKALST